MYCVYASTGFETQFRSMSRWGSTSPAWNAEIARSKRLITAFGDCVRPRIARQSSRTSSINLGVDHCRASMPRILNSSSSAILPKYFVNAPGSLSRCGTNATHPHPASHSRRILTVSVISLATVSSSSRSLSSASKSGVTRIESTISWTGST